MSCSKGKPRVERTFEAWINYSTPPQYSWAHDERHPYIVALQLGSHALTPIVNRQTLLLLSTCFSPPLISPGNVALDACSRSQASAAETRHTCWASVLFLWWHSDNKSFSDQVSALVLYGPLNKSRLTHPILEDVVTDTPAQDNRGHPVPFLEATAFPKPPFAAHDSHHLLLWNRQSLQALWVQAPLQLAGEQGADGAVAGSGHGEPVLSVMERTLPKDPVTLHVAYYICFEILSYKNKLLLSCTDSTGADLHSSPMVGCLQVQAVFTGVRRNGLFLQQWLTSKINSVSLRLLKYSCVLWTYNHLLSFPTVEVYVCTNKSSF